MRGDPCLLFCHNDVKKKQISKKLMARKPKRSHRDFKNGLPASVKLLQQNINRIIHAKINGRRICIKFVPLA